MDLNLKLKVLMFIYQSGRLVLPKTVLTLRRGFQQLRSEGLISVIKENNIFYASVSKKGEEFLAVTLFNYK